MLEASALYSGVSTIHRGAFTSASFKIFDDVLAHVTNVARLLGIKDVDLTEIHLFADPYLCYPATVFDHFPRRGDEEIRLAPQCCGRRHCFRRITWWAH